LVSVGSAGSFNFFSEDGLGSGFTNVFTEGFPVGVVIVLDGSGNFSEDIFTVDEEVFSNVVSELFWGCNG
jgi:hypothetical protein